MKIPKIGYVVFFVVLFVLLIVYVYIEKKYTAKNFVPVREVDYAQVAIKSAMQSMNDLKRSNISSVKPSSSDVYETQAIKLVKSKDFDDVAEKELDPMTKLAELAKSKSKNYVILKESDLNKKINLYENISKSEKVNTVVVPEIGKETSSITPIVAPCDYKIFKTSSSWASFIEYNRIRDNINVDFLKEDVVIIISKSDIPPGVFKIDSVKVEKNIARVLYRVDIFEISEDNKNAKRDFYTAAKIPKSVKKIELKQIQ